MLLRGDVLGAGFAAAAAAAVLPTLGAVFGDGLMALPYVKVLSSSSLSLLLVTSKYHGIFRI